TETIMPEPILVGRNRIKLEELAARSGVERWTTDVEEALADDSVQIYFDAQTTHRRLAAVTRAIEAGKHVYCDKPTALNTNDDVAHGKLWLPGWMKLQSLRDSGFFGEILCVRGEFGYWVFERDLVPAQRPSWNYRQEDGGGMVLDMFAHWRHVLDNLFGEVKS